MKCFQFLIRFDSRNSGYDYDPTLKLLQTAVFRRIPMKLTPRERFLAKVCPEPGSGCWLWRGMVVGSGYGMVRFERKMYAAHRLAWKLFRGEIAPGLAVCHKCDVRTCV